MAGREPDDAGGEQVPHDSFLAALSPSERRLLLERAVPRALDEGDILFLAGDRTRRVYLVGSGIVKLTARDGEGRETIVGLAVPGDLVGDLPAIDGLPQPVDGIAGSRCDLLGFSTDLLLHVLRGSHLAALELARGMASRLRWVCGTALERSTGEVPARLAGRLLDLADLLGRVDDGAVEVELPLRQADLGRLAGMCRESTCKALRRFKAQGLLDYRTGRIRILRPDALEQIRLGGALGE